MLYEVKVCPCCGGSMIPESFSKEGYEVEEKIICVLCQYTENKEVYSEGPGNDDESNQLLMDQMDQQEVYQPNT